MWIPEGPAPTIQTLSEGLGPGMEGKGSPRTAGVGLLTSSKADRAALRGSWLLEMDTDSQNNNSLIVVILMSAGRDS